MLDDDVFDSVTWESPSAPVYNDEEERSHGPGFRQSTIDSNEGPNDPKWEGYLITSVKDPVKELAETKDAYVSYLVSANVIAHYLFFICLQLLDKPSNLLNSESLRSQTLPGLCFSKGTPCQRFPRLCGSSFTWKTQIRLVAYLT